MSQNPLVISDGTGSAVLAAINSANDSLVTNNSGAGAPGTTSAYQWWADTTNGVLKQRNAGNTAWIIRAPLAETLNISRSSNTILSVGNYGCTILATTTFTQTLTAAATLGDGWWCEYRNNGVGTITLDPNASETIDGAATILLAPGEACVINCNGAGFTTLGREDWAGEFAEVTVASAATTNIGAAASRRVLISGTTTITSLGAVANVTRIVRFSGILTLTYNATSLVLPGAANITTAVGDEMIVTSDAAGNWRTVSYLRADGTVLVSSNRQIQPITASVSANALTLSLAATSLDFRSATVGSGVVNTRSVPATISVVVPSGATLGTTSAIASRLILVALGNAGTVELGVINLAGGANLDETGVVNTTAISAGASLPGIIYSTTARTGVPYRVVGFIDITEATAGTWATAPSTIQGYGGQALAAMSSLGYGQTWQNVTGSRAASTFYYNTTGKPIFVSIAMTISATAHIILTVNGVALIGAASPLSAEPNTIFEIIPVGARYSAANSAGTSVVLNWSELR